MKLFHVTITGADHSLSNIQELLRLSEEFRFVEWGILYSPNKQNELRYPPKDWQNNLFTMCDDSLAVNGWAPNLSAHLCGQYAIDVLFNNLLMLPSKYFKRCQINTSAKNLQRADIFALDGFMHMLAPGLNLYFNIVEHLMTQRLMKCLSVIRLYLDLLHCMIFQVVKGFCQQLGQNLFQMFAQVMLVV